MSSLEDLCIRLRAFNLWRGLDRDCLERFGAVTVPRRLTAGEHVWLAGDMPRHFIAIEAGLVQIQQIRPGGEGVLVGLFGPGDTLCITPALREHTYPADAVAASQTVDILCVPAATVLGAANDCPGLVEAINRTLVEHTEALRSKIGIVSAGTVPRRLAALFLYLAERFGRGADGKGVRIEIGLTREQMGGLVSARTETVIRIVSRWQKAGWLQTSSGGFDLLRRDMLERIAQS